MKIICIGRNYREHIREFDGGEPDERPVFFMKPDTALLRNNDTFWIPPFSREVHYETELVVKINRTGKCIAERFAHRYYDEVTLGIDFTARDLQRAAIAQGHPWEIGKAFDRSAAIAPRWLGLAALGRPVGELRWRPARYLISKSNNCSPSSHAVSRSPGATGPTPAGVPV